jgi:hypothetical protein
MLIKIVYFENISGILNKYWLCYQYFLYCHSYIMHAGLPSVSKMMCNKIINNVD